MRYDILVAGRPRTVTVSRAGEGLTVTVDAHTWRVGAARIDSQTLSLIVADVSRKGDTEGGRCYDVAITPGPPGAWSVHVDHVAVPVALNLGRRRREAGPAAADGPEQIAAPMPGKIVRLLVAAGQRVAPRQPLVVVEAMKMENELRAGRAGIVADVLVNEGASVDAGALLMIIR